MFQTRREVCKKRLNDKRFLKKIGMSYPEIASGAGVGYRWLMFLKTGERVNCSSDKVDYLWGFLEEEAQKADLAGK